MVQAMTCRYDLPWRITAKAKIAIITEELSMMDDEFWAKALALALRAGKGGRRG